MTFPVQNERPGKMFLGPGKGLERAFNSGFVKVREPLFIFKTFPCSL